MDVIRSVLDMILLLYTIYPKLKKLWSFLCGLKNVRMKKCQLRLKSRWSVKMKFPLAWMGVAFLVSLPGVSAQTLNCGPFPLVISGSLMRCFCHADSMSGDVELLLNNEDPLQFSSNTKVTRQEGVINGHILTIPAFTAEFDDVHITCVTLSDPHLNVTVTIRIAAFPNITSHYLKLINDSLLVELDVDRLLPATSYIFELHQPGRNVSLICNSTSPTCNYSSQDLLPWSCGEQSVVISTQNILGRSNDTEIRVVNHDLTIVDDQVLAIRGSYEKIVRIETEETVCDKVVDLMVKGMEQTYTVCGYNCVEFRAEDNQQLAVEFGGSERLVGTFDIQYTTSLPTNNAVHLEAGYAVNSVARGAFYIIVPLGEKNTVELDRSFFYVKSKTDSENGFTVDGVPRGSKSLQVHDLEENGRVSDTPAIIRHFNISGSPLRLPPRTRKCTLKKAGDSKLSMTCKCSAGLPLNILVLKPHEVLDGSPPVSLVQQYAATCGTTVMFDRVRENSDHYGVVLLYKEGQTVILDRSYLRDPANSGVKRNAVSYNFVVVMVMGLLMMSI